MRVGPRWFLGSADAIYQNLNLIEDERPDFVFVFGADHIYRFDPRQFLDHHIETGAGVTVAAIRVRRDQSDQFGVIQTGEGSKMTSFLEKPAARRRRPVSPTIPTRCSPRWGTTCSGPTRWSSCSTRTHATGGDRTTTSAAT